MKLKSFAILSLLFLGAMLSAQDMYGAFQICSVPSGASIVLGDSDQYLNSTPSPSYPVIMDEYAEYREGIPGRSIWIIILKKGYIPLQREIFVPIIHPNQFDAITNPTIYTFHMTRDYAAMYLRLTKRYCSYPSYQTYSNHHRHQGNNGNHPWYPPEGSDIDNPPGHPGGGHDGGHGGNGGGGTPPNPPGGGHGGGQGGGGTPPNPPNPPGGGHGGNGGGNPPTPPNPNDVTIQPSKPSSGPNHITTKPPEELPENTKKQAGK